MSESKGYRVSLFIAMSESRIPHTGTISVFARNYRVSGRRHRPRVPRPASKGVAAGRLGNRSIGGRKWRHILGPRIATCRLDERAAAIQVTLSGRFKNRRAIPAYMRSHAYSALKSCSARRMERLMRREEAGRDKGKREGNGGQMRGTF